ncbi:MAG: hypothetical protein AAF197_03615 [Pseudomonadota bacterium]
MSNSPSRAESKAMFWNRVQIIMILLVFAAPIVGAFLYQPQSFGNYGDIYTPVRPVENLTLQGTNGQAELDAFRRQWVFFIVVQEECSEVCEENILKMRQLRFMQNNDMLRIRTVVLESDLPVAVAEDLAAKYSPVEVYNVETSELSQWSEILLIEDAPVEANINRFYIIDPAGNLVMSYPAGADPSLIKKDIKRLLKTSQIG